MMVSKVLTKQIERLIIKALEKKKVFILGLALLIILLYGLLLIVRGFYTWIIGMIKVLETGLEMIRDHPKSENDTCDK